MSARGACVVVSLAGFGAVVGLYVGGVATFAAVLVAAVVAGGVIAAVAELGGDRGEGTDEPV